jgi:uncharacterized linocin/CFP29 family protein
MDVKHCRGCGTDQSVENFAWKNKMQGRRQSRCRSCQSTALKAWYGKNADSHKRSVAAYNGDLKRSKQALIRDLKASSPCADCGGRFHFAVMDFDHLERFSKERNISELVHSAHTVAKLMDEIAKCEIVCANCHRLRTFRRCSN